MSRIIFTGHALPESSPRFPKENPPLCDDGRFQATALGTAVRSMIGPQRPLIFSSRLARTKETAFAIKEHAGGWVVLCRRLRDAPRDPTERMLKEWFVPFVRRCWEWEPDRPLVFVLHLNARRAFPSLLLRELGFDAANPRIHGGCCAQVFDLRTLAWSELGPFHPPAVASPTVSSSTDAHP